MIFLDRYIFLLMIFSPLAASFFITLIPTTDTGSKLTVSRFFAFIGFITFARVFIIFLDHKVQTNTALSFSIINFNISLTLTITRFNIFLYGTAAASLLVNVFLYDVRDTKTNIHQVAPFLLTFFLYISFGQADLRVALPLLSIANFFVYFLIGFADQIRRGSTIFQMGIFLFACDALALVVLQIPFSERITSIPSQFINALLLFPGLSRLCLPLVAPFMKKLLLNVDDREGPFLIVFLQLAGLFIIVMAKADFTNLPDSLVVVLSSISVISAFYLSVLAILDGKMKTMPYYFLLFYSSLCSASLFFAKNEDLWFFSITLFITNIACFFYNAFIANLINQLQIKQSYLPRLAPLWFLTLALLLGLPGFGIGTSLWALLYRFLELGLFSEQQPWRLFWAIFALAWLLSLFLLSCAAVFSVRTLLIPPENSKILERRVTLKRSLLLSPFLMAVISLLIPMVIFYAKMQGI